MNTRTNKIGGTQEVQRKNKPRDTQEVQGKIIWRYRGNTRKMKTRDTHEVQEKRKLQTPNKY